MFLARVGSGPAMTLLHGFPSSSHDWAKAAPALAARHTCWRPDFLGFGASEKPIDHRYSLHEQADLVEALWAARGRRLRRSLVAHDYGVSVAQELLARAGEGALAARARARCTCSTAASTPTCTAHSRCRRPCSTPSRGRGSQSS